MLELNAHLRTYLPAENTFDWVLNCPGKIHRHIKHRRTVETEIGGRRYFIKTHRGCGWGEVIKDWLQFRPPIVSARTERDAIERVRKLGIPTVTVAAWGERGNSPARIESFIITDALEGMIHLEDFTRDWRGLRGRQRVLLKHALIKSLARIAGALHGAGLNHRDFYLGHFLVRDRNWSEWQPGQKVAVFLIDLHRMQTHPRLPERWRVKDLGGLLFSAFDAGLTWRDLLRFLEVYCGCPWHEALEADPQLWRKVWRNAEKLYLAHHGRPPPSNLSWKPGSGPAS